MANKKPLCERFLYPIINYAEQLNHVFFDKAMTACENSGYEVLEHFNL